MENSQAEVNQNEPPRAKLRVETIELRDKIRIRVTKTHKNQHIFATCLLIPNVYRSFTFNAFDFLSHILVESIQKSEPNLSICDTSFA